MSKWIDDEEWSDVATVVDEGWLSLIWILRGGLWNDDAAWVDSEVWDA